MAANLEWEGSVGRSWAELHEQTDRCLAGLTQQLLDRIAAFPGSSILDIGCGAGELTLALARARPKAHVIGLDISEDLVEVARSRGMHLSNLEFALGDAAEWRAKGMAPDLLISRHGVMFFKDPVAAFTHLRQSADTNANLVFSCFRSARENPWASDVARIAGLPPATNPHAPGPFAFADPQWIEAILEPAGWGEIDIAPVDFAYVAGQGADPVADARAFFARIGPAARALQEVDGEAREQLAARLDRWLEDHRDGDLVAFAGAAWIVTACANPQFDAR